MLAGLSVVLSTLAYLPALDGPFFADDEAYVSGNTRLQALPLSELGSLFTSKLNPLEFLPLRDLSYRIDLALFGLDPTGYHVHNLLLYVLCCWAVWLCTGSVVSVLASGKSAGPGAGVAWTCAVATAVFAAHPAHVESVAWVSGRKDLLSGLFALLALRQFAVAMEGERVRWRSIALGALLFALGLLAKSTIQPVVGLAFLLAWHRELRNRSARPRGASSAASPPARLVSGIARSISGPVLCAGRALGPVAPMAVVSAAFLWLAVAAGSETGVLAGDLFSDVADDLGAPQTALRILGTLTHIAALPVRLRLMYDVVAPGIPAAIASSLGAVALLSALVGCWALLRAGSVAGFAAAGYVLLCLPFLQLVKFNSWSLASERYLFLPVFCLALALGSLAPRIRASTVGLLTAGIVLAGSALVGAQSMLWRSEEALYRQNARLSPQLLAAQYLLVEYVLLPGGHHSEAEAAASRVRGEAGKRALLHYIAAHRGMARGDLLEAARSGEWIQKFGGLPATPGRQLLLGLIQERSGNPTAAIRAYHGAFKISRTPRDREYARRMLDDARRPFRGRLDELARQAASTPGDVQAIGALGNLQLELFMLEEAERSFKAILARFPDHPLARYNLGLTYVRDRRPGEAAPEFLAAIRGGVRGAEAWNNLALAYKESKQLEPALDAFRRAMEVDPAHWHAPFNMGMMHLALGQKKEARAALQEARRRLGGREDSTHVDQLLRELE